MCVFALICIPSRTGVAFRLNLFLARVRCRTSYFSGANFAPWVSAHCTQLRWISLSVSQLRSVERPYVSILTSSTNPTADTRNSSLFVASSRSAMKKRNSIGDSGDPWGIPVSVRNHPDSPSGSLILVCLSLRKLVTHRTIVSGIRRLRRLCNSLSCDTWLNAPDISRLRSVITCCGPGLP